MAQEYKSDILPYILHLSNQGSQSHELHQALLQLSDSFLLRLIGLRMRRMRLKRQPLALSLEQSASKLLSATAWVDRDKEQERSQPKGPTQARTDRFSPCNST